MIFEYLFPVHTLEKLTLPLAIFFQQVKFIVAIFVECHPFVSNYFLIAPVVFGKMMFYVFLIYAKKFDSALAAMFVNKFNLS